MLQTVQCLVFFVINDIAYKSILVGAEWRYTTLWRLCEIRHRQKLGIVLTLPIRDSYRQLVRHNVMWRLA